MTTEQVHNQSESPERIVAPLPAWGVRDLERGQRIIAALVASVGTDGFRELTRPLGRHLPRCADPDMALNGLERFLSQPGGAAQLPVLLESRARCLETFLQLVSTSHSFSDLLAANPDYLDMLLVPLRRSPSAAELQQQLQAEVDAAFEDTAILRAFRRFRQRQLLRIGTNDVIRDRPLDEITRDISRVADVALETALHTAWRRVSSRFGEPYANARQPARCVILAFGKLGGEELNYSSDVDLMFLYDEEGSTQGKRHSSIGNEEFFGRIASEVLRLLSSHTDRGQAYRIDLRLRPEGVRGPLARSLASTLSYYDTLGRTWERQALIKLRPVAGDLELGEEFLRAIEPFVYRKYLSFAEINEIKALKRQIEKKTTRAGTTDSEVKTGHGGIRDIEFVIQFLQLLNGGDLAEVHQRNTLAAMQALAEAGCLTTEEHHLLADGYRFLRKTEHRLQLLFDLQTHTLPANPDELHKLALRMGYADAGTGAGDAFIRDYREKTDRNRKVLDHLLHQTFQSGEDGQSSPEADLVLDPAPDPEMVRSVLGRYGFRNVEGAYQNLVQLAQESVPFLSTRRCRHFLASIALPLLRTLSETPDPDMALVNLEKVTASLGAKAILWEVFSFNPPSLKLYVDLCAWSDFLSQILISNPGMIDDLLDSMVLNQPRTIDELRTELAGLCKGADDLEPILHSFQDKEILRIGVRDILGKDSVQQTTAALSDLAETILGQIAAQQMPPLVKKYGVPHLAEGPRAGQPARFVLLGLGKLGGRELSYHSDLDLILVYEGDGRTQPPPGSTRWDRFDLTDNSYFFTELAQRIIRATSCLGPMGRLYQVDMRLRPTGQSGNLVSPLCEFQRYYSPTVPGPAEGRAHLWELQMLTRARVVHGDTDFGQAVSAAAAEGVCGLTWRPGIADEIVLMREKLQISRSERDLKRGFGGLVDVEFLVQLFQLKYGRERPAIRRTNTWEALDALREAGLLAPDEHQGLREGYNFLRQVESRLRIVHNRSLDELPEAPDDLERLARRLGFEAAPEHSAGQQFLARLEVLTAQTRELFLRLMRRERAS